MRLTDILITIVIVWTLGAIFILNFDKDWECQQKLWKQKGVIK